ncbi:MAG: 3-oxoacyl-ACP reductase FabG [Gammaproteobacteria bacterium]|nr:3-oxoacyl-ACP reductase FabG [Gammaproteobacteria bacterium]
MDEDLSGHIALVTGAARGIGRSIAISLAQRGAAVAVADLHPQPFRGEAYYRLRERWSGDDENTSTADAISAMGIRSTTVSLDVADRASIERAATECASTLGTPDILVNAAGIVNNISTIEKMSLEQWQHELSVNLTGAFNCVQVFSPAMVERRWGRIVNIASIAAERPGLGQPGYSASKAGLLGFTRSVAQEFGPAGITCNAIMPGLIMTPLVKSMPEHLRDAIVAATPVSRVGEPEDIGTLAAFLCSPSASFISAAAIPCDGGYSNAPLRGLNR